VKTRSLITIVLLILAACLHLAVQRSQGLAEGDDSDQTFSGIPRAIGGFTQIGSDIEADEDDRKVLQTNAILTRRYASSRGWPIELTIVFAGKTRGSLHFPEVCLVGHGWELREQYTAPVGFLFTAKHLLIFKGEEQEAVLYWFKTGDQFTGNYFMNSLYWILRKLTFSGPTSAMIRLGTTFRQGEQEVAFRVLEDFAIQIAPIIKEQLR
jgi:EpsI family protein